VSVAAADPLAAEHAAALPQKDNLCGAFWAALALRASGITEWDGEPVDQDLVALRAGTILPPGPPATSVPPGATPRLDYRVALPVSDAPESSGTDPAALVEVVEAASGGALRAVPLRGRWTAERAEALVERARSLGPDTRLIANLRTGPLWGSRPAPEQLLAHLAGEPVAPPPADWDVGHFVALAALLRGAGGSLVVVRDSYPSLGWDAHHLQPPAALAAALQRGDGREGGILVVVPADAAAATERLALDLGLELGAWDNGTRT
jgi:hypothetical protein